MTRFSGFPGKEKYYKISFDTKLVSDYLLLGYNVIFVEGEKVSLYPEKKSYLFSRSEKEFVSELGEGGYIELDSNAFVKTCAGIRYDNVLYITDKCNSNCIMCPMAESVRKNGAMVPFEDLKEQVHYMPYGMEHITITGGEPFLLKERLFELIDDLKKGEKAWSYLLLTNGRALSSKYYSETLSEVVPEGFLLGVPIHGHTSELHDRISQTQNSFIQTCEGVKNILSLNKMSVEIRIVVNRLNVLHLYDISNLILKRLSGIKTVKIMGMEMLGNAVVNSGDVWFPYERSFEYIKPAVDNLIKNGVDVALYNYPLCFIDKEYWNICMNSITAYKIRYSDICDSCCEKEACGGMFLGTDKYIKEMVKPIKYD